MPVRVAVIPAAGRGTRFLPFTKAVPKELLPVGASPAIQRIVDECLDAGIDHLVVVTSRTKPALEAYLTPSPELVEELRASGHEREAAAVEHLGRDLRVTIVHQDAPRGLGHAVGCAESVIGEQPFAVLLPDEIMGDASMLRAMLAVAEVRGGSVVGLMRVPPEELRRYGVVAVDGEPDDAGVVAVRGMVEKPVSGTAPSDLAIIGRYVLTPAIFDELRTVAGRGSGEIQLTDAIDRRVGAEPVHGVLNRATRHDTGNPLGWFQAVVDTMLADAPLSGPARAWLAARLAQPDAG